MDLSEIFQGRPSDAKWQALGQYLKKGAIRGGPGVRVRQVGNKTMITAKRGGHGPPAEILPFEISVSGTNLILAPGTIQGASKAELIKEDPADGMWYAEAKLVINTATGSITSTDVQWVDTPSTDGGGEFFLVIGSIEVADGEPDMETLTQNTYGPVLAILYGGISTTWEATLL